MIFFIRGLYQYALCSRRMDCLDEFWGLGGGFGEREKGRGGGNGVTLFGCLVSSFFLSPPFFWTRRTLQGASSSLFYLVDNYISGTFFLLLVWAFVTMDGLGWVGLVRAGRAGDICHKFELLYIHLSI